MFLKREKFYDILKALHPGIYSIVIFDNYWGNDRGREDGLNATNMKSGYGGSKLEMHQDNIKQEVCYLCPHEKNIEAGYDKHMVFQ